MSMYVTLEKKDHIATLKINRPEAMNALNMQAVNELDLFVDEIQQDIDVRVLIITGDKNFAAGADIKAMVDLKAIEAKAFCFSDTFQKIYNLGIPTIAAIEGYALGGGLELALTCDFRIASSKAKMGFPETGLGIMPGAGGTILATPLIGQSKAMELILLGTIIDSEEALKINLINKITEHGRAYEEALRWSGIFAKGAPIALRMAKKTIRQGIEAESIGKGIEIEKTNWSKLFDTLDQKEGMRAFLEKRSPNYMGE